MPRLTKVFEKAIRSKMGVQQQELHITANTDEQGYFDDYAEVQANLFIDGKFIADISHVLDKSDVFIQIVDSIEWPELAADIKVLN